MPFRADSERLASCSYDGTVLVWDTGDPSRPAPLARLRHRRLVNGAAWHPADPALLATASADKTVAVWRIPEDGGHSLVSVLARHTDDVNAVAWMPDGRRLVCVSEDGRAMPWDAGTGALIAEIGAHTAHCMMVAVNRDGLVATVGEDGGSRSANRAARTSPTSCTTRRRSRAAPGRTRGRSWPSPATTAWSTS
ncbi:hypothetical protein [Actinomadura hallensis]|uniref:WD40 repeat domain-containing protein n=1 Tax=Actinomadura hallensis TaxID=337895 RepID=UPI001C89C987